MQDVAGLKAFAAAARAVACLAQRPFEAALRVFACAGQLAAGLLQATVLAESEQSVLLPLTQRR